MKTLAPTNRHGVRRAYSSLLLAFVLVAAGATLRAQGSAVRVETFSLKVDGEVVVENSRGATRVESWEQQTVRVVAEKKGPAGSALEGGELVLMGALNSVIIQCRQGAGRIDLTIYAPTNSRLQVTGGTWPVDISGSLASAQIDTTSGAIAYRLPGNDDARVAMRSTVGTVRSTVPLTAVERIGTHSIQGQLGTGTAQLVLNSQTGNVTLIPGPNLSAIAKVSTAEARAAAANAQQPQDVISTDSASGNQTSTNQRAGAPSQRVQRDPAQQADPDGGDPGATRQAVQSNGSMVFAGSDQSDDASMTQRSGPLSRPRTQRNTGGGNSGLKVRIIPSDGQARREPDANDSVFDQTADDQDAQKANPSGQPNAGKSSSTYQSNGSVVFGGSDRSDDGSSKARVGPLERERQQRDTSGGNSGLRVRIIPAPDSSAPARRSSTVFDQLDENEVPAPVAPPARRAPQTSQSNRSSDFDRPPLRRPVEQDEEIASAPSRGGTPPVLHRSTAEDPTGAAVERETSGSNPDEEAIVLKAALVNLNVSVTNRAGVALSNLKKEDFEVAENSEPQKIEFFQPTTAPFNLVLALDLSGSIKDKLDIVKSAALRFVDTLGPQDKVAVVTFTDEIRVVSQLTSDRDELKRRIKEVDRSQGGTAFYEAMWFSLVDTLRGTRGQRNAIVVMTDGVDSSLDRYSPMQSRVSFNQLARRLEESDVMVFPIYLDTEYEEVFERGNSTSEAYAIARDQLERISELTGGQAFKAEKFGDLAGVYKQVVAAIRTVYSVGYYPTNSERDGTFRRVRVVVNRSDAAVRTRKGYYAK
jgi:VWFA-related protein